MYRIIIFYLFALSSCLGNDKQRVTPKEFVNYVVVDSSLYKRDKSTILNDLYVKMKNHEASFANPEYFDSTELIIDTIMYDTSTKKVALFVIAKNPTYRNPHSDSPLPYYYNASCYLGKRRYTDSSKFELKHLGPFSMVNFNDKNLISKAIKEYFFLELATVLDANKKYVFEYNMDDKRFWESATGWKRVFTE